MLIQVFSAYINYEFKVENQTPSLSPSPLTSLLQECGHATVRHLLDLMSQLVIIKLLICDSSISIYIKGLKYFDNCIG